MGSYDGAETCELVGCFLLDQLKKIPGINIGLYRDDGLAVMTETPRNIERSKKDICKIFANNGLRVTIEANKKIVNFLDVTLDLNTGKFKPYSKPANTPLYVHSRSNHPPNIIRNIPESINRRLSEISYDEETFNDAAPQYQEALRNSGYVYELKFKPKQQTTARQRNRQRNIIWFNPPFSKNVSTNVGKEFLKLVVKCFTKDHVLRKIFNRNTLKISYSCMPNVKQIIDGHNKTTVAKNEKQQQGEIKNNCNCRKKRGVPFKWLLLNKGNSLPS